MKFLVKSIYFLFICASSIAQSEHLKVAIFTPLYLDSVFDAAGNITNDKYITRYSEPGINFVLGAQIALDSLKKRNLPLDIYFYDLKGREPLSSVLNHTELNDVDLMIGQSNMNETKLLAEASLHRKIPFISVSLPNDAKISNDPYFVMLNSSLQTHVDGICHYLQKFYTHNKIIVFRKKGAQEDEVKKYFMDYLHSSTRDALNIKFVDIENNFTPTFLASNLDSTQKSICIAGSLESEFGMKLAQQLATLHKSYPVTLIGMPTWENINLQRANLTDIEIIYSTSFYYNRTTNFENQLASDFYNKMITRPDELFFKGYETTLRFCLLLNDTRKDIASNLTRKGYSVLTQMDIQPVFKDKKTMTLDYFENKHLYFIKVFGGVKNIIY